MLREFDQIVFGMLGLGVMDRLHLWGRRLVSRKSADAIPPLESVKMIYPHVHSDEMDEGVYSFREDLGALIPLILDLKARRARGEILRYDYGMAHVYDDNDRVRMTDCVSVFIRPTRQTS